MAKKKTTDDRERLQNLIEEATVDANGEEEQLMGLATMIDDNVVCPFTAHVVGEEVKVTGFDCPDMTIYALCERKGKKHRVEVSSLQWPDPQPEGFEWIEAYLAWREWNS